MCTLLLLWCAVHIMLTLFVLSKNLVICLVISCFTLSLIQLAYQSTGDQSFKKKHIQNLKGGSLSVIELELHGDLKKDFGQSGPRWYQVLIHTIPMYQHLAVHDLEILQKCSGNTCLCHPPRQCLPGSNHLWGKKRYSTHESHSP